MLNQVGLQIINVCNGQCIMCDKRLCKPEKPIHMALSQIESLVDQIRALGIVTTTGICGIAEAVFHPQFEDAVRIVSAIPWSFGSNCQGLTEKKSEIILRYRPKIINLSIDAVTAAIHTLMRPNLQYERVVANALAFVEAVKRGPVWDRQFYIQMVVTKLNGHQVQAFIDYWLPIIEGISGLFLHIKPCFAWPRIPKEELSTFYPSPYISKSFSNHPQVMVDEFHSTSGVREHCRLYWNFAWIKADGSYMPCCMCGDDLWNVGNVFESSISECYSSSKMVRLRCLFEQRRFDELPLCNIC